MKILGLIGYPLSHSFSKKYFSQKFVKENITDYKYELFPITNISNLSVLLKQEANLCGLNITIPYKQQVIPYLNELEDAAKQIGAVNTIKITEGYCKGFNTDAYGFEQSLLPLLQKQHTQALVLGTGGAAKAVQYVLRKLGIRYQLVSRTEGENKITYSSVNQEVMQQNKLIINTTPLGMYPKTNDAPHLPYSFATPQHLFYDLVYNPPITTFLAHGQAQGAQIKNGLEMLHLQAEKAWEIWQSTD